MKFYKIMGLLVFVFMMSCANEKPKKKTSITPTIKTTKKVETPKEEMTTSASSTEKEETATQEEPKEEAPKVVPIPPEEIKKAKEIIAGVSAEDIGAVDAKKKFKMFCAACHGFTGDLNVNGAKDLTQSKLSLVESVAQVYHGRGLMTPFKGILSDAEIVAVAQYIEQNLRK